MTSNSTVSIVTEIPSDLHQSMQNYLDNHPYWDQDRLIAAGISLFLLQNWGSQISRDVEDYRTCSRIYLETLFRDNVKFSLFWDNENC
ncbi:DUF2811 domain-containing protein [Pleurocapsales cyanobacterium LEGE 06147]|nr:DUF2811 domain-containing protein [Pleurocapsales cyanobacterium LEGE 06147]